MRILILLGVLLGGCSAQPPMPPAVKPVQWVKVPADQIHAKCREMSNAVLVIGRINGCSFLDNGVCKIYAADFSIGENEKMGILGHELKHCFDGGWHQ